MAELLDMALALRIHPGDTAIAGPTQHTKHALQAARVLQHVSVSCVSMYHEDGRETRRGQAAAAGPSIR